MSLYRNNDGNARGMLFPNMHLLDMVLLLPLLVPPPVPPPKRLFLPS